MEQATVIVGAGQAAATAIETLRREGLAGPLVLVGEEAHLPYARPPLSKAYLSGDMPVERLILKPASYYESHGVMLKTGRRAVHLDLAGRAVTLDDVKAMAVTYFTVPVVAVVTAAPDKVDIGVAPAAVDRDEPAKTGGAKEHP